MSSKSRSKSGTKANVSAKADAASVEAYLDDVMSTKFPEMLEAIDRLRRLVQEETGMRATMVSRLHIAIREAKGIDCQRRLVIPWASESNTH